MPAFIVTGLGYGDEGKGAVVDYLARAHNASGVVLHNGGAQRAHNVVAEHPSGLRTRHHTFSQFSSASFLPSIQTFHAPTAMIDPHAFFLEADDLVAAGVYRPWERVVVHPETLVTTPFHVAANKIHAIHNGHGSCGMGIGETAFDAIKEPLALRASDLLYPKMLHWKLKDAQMRMRRRAHSVGLLKSDRRLDTLFNTLHDFEAVDQAMEVYRIFAKVVRIEEFELDADKTWIFEGSQGVLLDEYAGFHPHTTWSKTAGQNAKNLLADYSGNVRHVGVLRSYMTRHGNGPFVTEDQSMNVDERFSEAHNGQGEWQGAWRRGWTDLVALGYAIKVAQPDELAVTHLDRVRGPWKICASYDSAPWMAPPRPGLDRQMWEANHAAALAGLNSASPEYLEYTNMDPDTLLTWIEAKASLPITITSSGPTHGDFRAHTADPALV